MSAQRTKDLLYNKRIFLVRNQAILDSHDIPVDWLIISIKIHVQLQLESLFAHLQRT